ncbi:hypothetical protein SXCC_03020 [Gluconacetobacter sp. SXCC-1]|nr:hypothetical protein SXCC_03020 [Gluconacetobacter sp. SXCC-1]
MNPGAVGSNPAADTSTQARSVPGNRLALAGNHNTGPLIPLLAAGPGGTRLFEKRLHPY